MSLTDTWNESRANEEQNFNLTLRELRCRQLHVASPGTGRSGRCLPLRCGHLAQQMVPELQDGESGLVLLVRQEAGDDGKGWDPHTCSCSSPGTEYE